MIDIEVKEKLSQIKRELGMLLLEIRLRNGLTQQFVAESIEMSYRNMHIIERKYESTLDEIFKLYTFYYTRNYGSREDEERFRMIVGMCG